MPNHQGVRTGNPGRDRGRRATPPVNVEPTLEDLAYAGLFFRVLA